MPGIHIFFRHKVQAVDFDRRVLTALNQEGNHDIQVEFDLCIGADGSYSVVRRQMQRVVR
jgi:kynurenine 3-monooxygenase